MKTTLSLMLIISLASMVLISACSKNEPEPKLEASFTISSNPAYAEDSVYFLNTSIGADSFKWFFGDGTSSNLENPTHVYSKEGEYTVTLDISNSERSDNTSVNISIFPPFEQWKKHVIDDNVKVPVSVDLADYDGDGDDDVLVPAFSDDEIIWYENNSLSWTKNKLDQNNDGMVVFAYSGDMNNDGTIDVVATFPYSWQIVLFTSGSNGWEEHIIDENTHTCEYFSIIDLNEDGKLDIMAAGDGDWGGPVKWFENQYPDWIEHIIDEETNNYRSSMAVDIDNDGLLDVAATMNVKGKVVWFKNEGYGLPWTKYTIDDNIPGAFGLNIGDINGDNTIDILVTTGGPYDSGGLVVWYENNHPNWTRKEIDNDLDGAVLLAMVDINGNDKTDIVATGYFADEVVWYEYDQQSWNKYFIDDNLDGPRMFYLTDLNDDDLIDIIVTASNSVVWYEQMVR